MADGRASQHAVRRLRDLGGSGEFGPVLVFSGTTRGYTEVLPTTVFLELSTYSLEGAVAVSVLMVVVALVVLLIVRVYGMDAGPTGSR